MEKVVHLLRALPDPAAGDELRERLLADVVPRLLREPEVHGVAVLVHDSAAAEAPSPAPAPPGEAVHVAVVSTWVDCYQRRPALEVDGFDVAAHLVVESLYSDYDGGARYGEGRSPGVLTVAVLHRPSGLDEADWLHAWHEVQSPRSGELQPRTRYVRNRVVQHLTPGAPPCDGVVEEAWPSAQHVADPDLYFSGGGDPAVVSAHLEEMMQNVAACLDLERLRVMTMSEHLVRA